MSHSLMIRWIEDAEERRFNAVTIFERPAHSRRLPAWLAALAHIGCARSRKRA